MHSYQIVLADDHLMLRHGIRRMIEEAEVSGCHREACDKGSSYLICSKIVQTWFILDLSMPKLGAEAATEMRRDMQS